MPMPPPSGDRGSLERLCGDEAELERNLAEARRMSADALAAARGEAERIAAEARTALERELARARAGAEEELAREASRSREAAAEEVGALARRADENRPRALARLVEIVLRGGGP